MITVRKFALSLAAIAIALSFASAPASAQYRRHYDQGGVIPGSQDDAHYDQLRKRWVPNRHHRANNAVVHRGSRVNARPGDHRYSRRGYDRAGFGARSRSYASRPTSGPIYEIGGKQPTLEVVGVAASQGFNLAKGKPGNSDCFTLSNGIRRCPNHWTR